MRLLASHRCDSGSIPAWCHMWFEFAVASCLAPRVFFRVLRFSPLKKPPASPNSNSTKIVTGMKVDVASPRHIVYLYLSLSLLKIVGSVPRYRALYPIFIQKSRQTSPHKK